MHLIFIFASLMPTITFSDKKLKRVSRINEIVKEYFNKHPGITKIAARDLMQQFISKGIFLKDVEKGLPIRLVLRELINNDQLSLLTHTILKIERRVYYFCRKQ